MSLRVVPEREDGAGLEELLGPPQTRPGELHERYPDSVPAAFVAAARAQGVALSLAVSVVCERQLTLRELTVCDGDVVQWLDEAAQHQRPATALPKPGADYVRGVVAALSGRSVTEPAGGPPVISMRLASRLRASNAAIELDADEIRIALRWELAATVSGATMVEWALRHALRAPGELELTR